MAPWRDAFLGALFLHQCERVFLEYLTTQHSGQESRMVSMRARREAPELGCECRKEQTHRALRIEALFPYSVRVSYHYRLLK